MIFSIRTFVKLSMIVGLTAWPRYGAADNGSNASQTETVAETRSIMAKMFTSLTSVLPLSLNQDQFSAPENRDKVLSELKKLREGASTLVPHTSKFDESYRYIAKSMARDLREIYALYDRGAISEARFLLQHVSENCVSCHLKLKDPGHAPSMDAFFKDVNVTKLTPLERAHMQVALRQFDDALKTWEDMFASWAKSSELFAMDALSDYLKVAIRVKNEPKRALDTLKVLGNRVDLPKFMKREVAAWISSLTKLAPEVTKKGNELKRAAKLIQSARSTMEYPLDRTGLIDYIVASGMLNNFLNAEKRTPEQSSEAYYLLGLTETLIGRSTWLTQTDYYLEAAIRSAPKSKHAKLAFDALEQQILLEYSGSGGTFIPEDIEANLKELRHLVQGK